MNGKYKVNEIANLLGVSQTTIYKRFAEMKKPMKPHYYKEKGILLFNETALNLFRESISTATKDSLPAKTDLDINSPIKEEISELKKAVLVMAEKMQMMVEENRALRSEVLTLQKSLEYKKPEPTKTDTKQESLISSESQSRRTDPREGFPAKSDFWKELQKVSAWLEGVASPFVQVFRG